MAMVHPMPSLSLCWRGLGNGILGERRRSMAFAPPIAGKLTGGGISETGSPVSPRKFGGSSKVKLTEVPVVENGQRIGSFVNLPITCFQILGVTEKAEKDEIVKVTMELKNSEIENGYTADVIVSRQALLVDVRDKLLFEQDYAGNVKEKVPPKSSLRIPWVWLPGALCILQEVGEVKLVLEIGQAALHLQDVKPYIHDLLLSMALAEIEESLEELAPACTLELLVPHAPDNDERRRGAIAALRELLRHGLEVETSSRVQDLHCFLCKALEKLMATEIVDLISWDALAISRKNKKSRESQNQRVVINIDCFYMALIAHIALGFSTRQIDLITKAKTICECLIASDGMDLKFEEAFCSLLLGQGCETETVEMLRQLEINGTPPSRKFGSITKLKNIKEKDSSSQTLETWLKDSVLCVFRDTQDSSLSLANFFGGPKRILRGSKQSLGPSKPFPSINHRSVNILPQLRASGEQSRINSSEHLGKVVKQLAPANTGSTHSQLKRNLGLPDAKFWEMWCFPGDLAGKISGSVLVGCVILSTLKLLALHFGNASRIPYKLQSSYLKLKINSSALIINASEGSLCATFIEKKVFRQLWKLLAVIRLNNSHQTSTVTVQDAWPCDDLSSLTAASAISDTSFHRTQMPPEEAETLVKQWQEIKSEALGPHHRIHALPEILAESMLLKWQDLANSAKVRSCFWRFVLLQLSIQRADILFDEVGSKMAEIEAVLEEAAELVDESQLRRPSYYRTYKVQYLLKRQDDGSWKFCRGTQSPL